MLHVWLFLANFQRSGTLLTNLPTTNVDLLKNHQARSRELYPVFPWHLSFSSHLYVRQSVKKQSYCTIGNNIL
ncbi:mCG1025842 [Mus musculus]|nr:mCG1025842 [Mus musculus]